MKVFIFRQREQFPESSQLDQALSNLDASGLISRRNLAPRYYMFEEPLDRSYGKYSKRILSAAGVKTPEMVRAAQKIKELMQG